ncbi:OsmC family protein [Ruania alba]|uniref:Organic hydroperoxide reductase OsmC/OhrA n=1 Tax=Ruania alba TaxID=648782 RepID=A0A1H5GFA2_9MICO|nr:OsmC family protein [Ruania alba]SEE14397.1 Organic hydroperoxide reductase OsmC/OhrA [Ruania alba]
MGPLHTYSVTVDWTGAGERGTESYTAYSRDHEVTIEGKPALPGSADPAFRGDADRYSPEELFVASLSQCHMLWFLHRAAVAGVVVTGYVDRATGTMRVETAGAGQFTEVTLHPKVTVAHEVSDDVIVDLHQQAHDHCFIARSVNFPVRHMPATTRVAEPA